MPRSQGANEQQEKVERPPSSLLLMDLFETCAPRTVAKCHAAGTAVTSLRKVFLPVVMEGGAFECLDSARGASLVISASEPAADATNEQQETAPSLFGLMDLFKKQRAPPVQLLGRGKNHNPGQGEENAESKL